MSSLSTTDNASSRHVPSCPVLAGRTAVVTGAGKGLGAGIAAALAAAGARVVVNYARDAAADATAAAIPLGRLGTPEDIAPVAVFLASAAAGFITGDVIHASGGDL